MEENDEMKVEDICTHYGEDYSRVLGAVVPPLFMNTLFTRKKGSYGYSYTRINNPTTEIAERKIAELEYGEAAKLFSSGMAAITAAIMYWLEKDSHVVTVNSVYGPVREFLGTYLSRFGVEVTFVKNGTVEEFGNAIKPNTKLFYLESPSSNVFVIQDIEGITKLAKQHGIATVVDNTWATPVFQNPLRMGVDMVVHSVSKYLGGHSDIVGGVLIANSEIINNIIHNERALFGGVMDPFQSWLLIRSLRTLPLRMKQHQENAMKVAQFLSEHPKVSKVFYPGLASHPQYKLGRKQMKGYSSLMSFIPRGNLENVRAFIQRLRFFEEGPSWGGFESLINTPGVGVSEEKLREMGIPPGLIRIHIGLENVDSIIEDLDQALEVF